MYPVIAPQTSKRGFLARVAILSPLLCGGLCACISVLIVPLTSIPGGFTSMIEGVRMMGFGWIIDLIPSQILTLIYGLRDAPVIGLCCGVLAIGASITLFLYTGGRGKRLPRIIQVGIGQAKPKPLSPLSSKPRLKRQPPHRPKR